MMQTKQNNMFLTKIMSTPSSSSHPSSNNNDSRTTHVTNNNIIRSQYYNNCNIDNSVNGTGQANKTDDGDEAQSDSAKDAGKKEPAIDCDTGATQTTANGEVHPDSSKDTNGKYADKVHPDSYSKDADGEDSDRNMRELSHIIHHVDSLF